ncbi:MAG: GH32 C-terminal domain-containing protein, partial [Clostridiales bacterium]|nr:GH32 C-terminal domain-containing protein [Clostridiales bacterium]
YLTREAGRQEQILIYSDDEGVTWKKHGVVIATEQNAFYDPANAGIAFRDPKIFELGNGKWGIIVGGGRYQFYVSSDRVHWEYSSCLPVDAECPDIVKIATDDGDKWVITMSSRQYLVGELRYEDNKIKFFNESGKELTAADATLADCNVRTMDFGPDAYASQTFYIADPDAAYYGKAVAISWFNDPLIEWGDNANAMAALRDPWNGGFTFPVELGLRKAGDEYVLTQTPIAGIADVEETVWETDGERTVSATDENLLAQVRGAQLDIEAQVAFTAGAHFGLRVQEGIDGYIEIGYDQTGYYVDRSHASNGGTEIPRYLRRYDSHTQAADGVATWRILTDANSVEVFAEHGTVPFFAASFPSQGSTGVSLFTDADITVQSLTVRRVTSVWREQDDLQEDCTWLQLSASEIYLAGVFAYARTVAAF